MLGCAAGGGGLGGVDWTYQPAAFERALDSTRGVSIHGFVFGEGSAIEPMVTVFVFRSG